ncbi:MAG: SpoIIE family protein phosphatase [bacterium]|nr:SpoIIE family protein phosphatase [bacterium]
MNIISIIGALLSSLLLFGMALFVLIKDWRDQVNRYYVFYNMAAMGILLTMFLTYAFPDKLPLTQVNRLTQMFTILFFGGCFTVSLVFPKAEKKFPFIISLLILIPAFVLAGLAGFTNLTISEAFFKDGQFDRTFTLTTVFGFSFHFYNVYAAVGFSYLLLAAVNFIRKYIKTTVDIYKLQMRYVFVASSGSIIFAAVCSIILPKFFGYSELYVIGPTMTTFFVTVSLFYSVIAYNLMDITTAIHKTSMYIIISMLIFIPIYGLVFLFRMDLRFLKEVPFYLFAVAIVAVFIIFSLYIQPVIDKLFRRKHYEFERILDKFIISVEKIKDIKKIIEKTVSILHESLFLKSVFFIMLDDDTRKYELLAFKGNDIEAEFEPVARNSSVIRWFARNQELLTRENIYKDDKSFEEIRGDLIEFYENNNVRIVIPVYHARRILGLLCMGVKDTLSSYTPDELETLQLFQTEINELISTARTYEEAMKEQMVARTIDLSSAMLAQSVPRSLPNLKGIKFGAFVIPKYKQGADYFDFIRPGSQGVGVIASDVSGGGVNSSLYSVLLRSAFQSSIHEASSTFSVMKNLNRVLYEYNDGSGELTTAYYLYYDTKFMRLMYTNAGFPALEVFRVDKNDFDSLDTEGIPLGNDSSYSYGIGRTNMLRGDIGVLYSRSLINSKNKAGETYGLSRVRNIIKDNRANRPAEIIDHVKLSFQEFMGLSSLNSDVLVLLFKIV